MDKLEQYRDEVPLSFRIPEYDKASTQEEIYSEGYEEGFKKGFDTALELSLPIKFAEWLSGLIISNYQSGGTWVVKFNGIGKVEFKTSQELYEYWLKNIFEL